MTFAEHVEENYMVQEGDLSAVTITDETQVLFGDEVSKRGILTLFRATYDEQIIVDAGVPDDNNRVVFLMTQPRIKYVKKATA